MSVNQTKGPPGYKVQVTAPTGGLTAGRLHALRTGANGCCGEVQATTAAGSTAIVECGHHVELPKLTGTGESFSQGDVVYGDASTGKATPNATGNNRAGTATAAASTSATTVWTLLGGY